jgi:hypothetical protein
LKQCIECIVCGGSLKGGHGPYVVQRGYGRAGAVCLRVACLVRAARHPTAILCGPGLDVPGPESAKQLEALCDKYRHRPGDDDGWRVEHVLVGSCVTAGVVAKVGEVRLMVLHWDFTKERWDPTPFAILTGLVKRLDAALLPPAPSAIPFELPCKTTALCGDGQLLRAVERYDGLAARDAFKLELAGPHASQ